MQKCFLAYLPQQRHGRYTYYAMLYALCALRLPQKTNANPFRCGAILQIGKIRPYDFGRDFERRACRKPDGQKEAFLRV